MQKRTVAGTQDYSFDLSGQLTGVSSSDSASNENFTYDSIGNRLTDKNGNFMYDETSQLIKEDYQYFYAHDNNGNLISKTAKDLSKDSFSYTYSSTNQLTSVRVYQSLAAPIKKQVNYQYDVLGRRLQKEVVDNVDTTKSMTRKYVYNGDNIFAELDGSNQMLATYTHSPLGTDDILEADVTLYGAQAGLAQASGKYQYLKDVLGSVTDVMDTSGNIVQHYDYTAYGKIRKITDADGVDITENSKISTSFTYTGREYDSEIGIYYYRARYYDANTGRFLQRDSDPGNMTNPASVINAYSYVQNNPLMFTDPTGRTSIFGWLLAAAFPIMSLIAMNTTDFFQKNFGFTQGDIRGFNTVAITAAIIGASALTGGAAAGAANGTMGGFVAGATVGGATGAVIGGVGFPALGLGTSHEGFLYGLAVGAVAGGIAGSSNAILRSWDKQVDLWNKNGPFKYFFDFAIDSNVTWYEKPFINAGPSWGGTGVIFALTQLAPKK